MLVQNTLANQYPSALRENILSAMLVSKRERNGGVDDWNGTAIK
jgi:hypothetical protein